MSVRFGLARWCLSWSALLGATVASAQQPAWMQKPGSAPRGAYYAGVARGAAGYAPAVGTAPGMAEGAMPAAGAWAAPSVPPLIPGATIPPSLAATMPGAIPYAPQGMPSGMSPNAGPPSMGPPPAGPPGMPSAPDAAGGNVTPTSYVAPPAAGYGAQGYGAPGYGASGYGAPGYGPGGFGAAGNGASGAAPAPMPAYSAAPAISPAGPQWNMQGTMTTVRPSVAQILSASRTAPTVAQQADAVRQAGYAAPASAPAGPALGPASPGPVSLGPVSPGTVSPGMGAMAAPAAARPLAFPAQSAPSMAGHRAVGPYTASGSYGAAALTAQAMPGMPGMPAGVMPGTMGGDFSGPVTSYETLPGSVLERSPGAPTAPSGGTFAAPYSGPSLWGGPTPDQLSSGFGPAGAAAGPNYGPGMFDGYGGAGGCDTCDPSLMPMVAGRSCGPWFASIGGLIMTRDVPNNKGLAYANIDPAMSVLNTEQAGFDWVGGWEGRIGRSIGQRWAGELVYWGLQPMDSQISVRGNNDINSRLDFGTVAYQGVPEATYFNNAHEQRIHRVDEFHNVEINLLQSALAVDPAGRFGMTFFSGARYFYYRENFDYMSVMANAEFSDNDPATQSGYHIRTHNHLIGWQIGARGTMYVGNRLRLFATPRFGLFANNISQNQDLCMVINLHSRKNDVALMGQIDLGMSYQVFRCCSVYAGYRAMGIAGVANADDNIPFSFMSQPDMAQINSSGSIILHGGQAGVQFQF